LRNDIANKTLTHTLGDPAQPPTCRISSAIFLSHKQPWTLQRGSVSRLFDVTVRHAPSHVWKLFCTYVTVKFLTLSKMQNSGSRRDAYSKLRDPHVSNHQSWEDDV